MDRHNNYQNSRSQKKYSRITAQFAKNTVRKKIYEIKKRGRLAADELLDTVEEMLQKNMNNNPKRRTNDKTMSQTRKKSEVGSSDKCLSDDNSSNEKIYNEIAETIAEGIALADKLRGPVGVSEEITPVELFLIMLKNDRSKWRDFLCRVVEMSDAETLACFLVNLIYGGYMTEKREGRPCASFIEIKQPVSQNTVSRLREILKNDLSLGKRVCFVRGNDLFSTPMLHISRHFNETAFILLSGDLPPGTRSLFEQGIYNVLFIPEIKEGKSGHLSDRRAFSGIAVIINEDDRGGERAREDTNVSRLCTDGGDGKYGDLRSNISAGQGSHAILSYGRVQIDKNFLKQLFYFLSSPDLPVKITFNDLFEAVCKAELLISQNAQPDKYTL